MIKHIGGKSKSLMEELKITCVGTSLCRRWSFSPLQGRIYLVTPYKEQTAENVNFKWKYLKIRCLNLMMKVNTIRDIM
jgi:hypothetical protein